MSFKYLLFVLALAGIAHSNPTEAASFDCQKARTNMERTICSSPALSKLDETLSLAYKTARAELSSTAQATLVSSQRSWLRFIGVYCLLDTQAAAVSQREATECLLRVYQSRIKELNETGKIVAGFKTFTAIDNHIRVTKAQEAVYVVERKFIQVDDTTDTGRSLNAYLGFANQPELTEDRGAESFDTQLSQRSADWLLKQTHIEIFTGAYPSSQTECGIYSLSKQRPLKIGDIFQSREWSAIIERAVRQHFEQLAKTEKEFDPSLVSGLESIHQPGASPFSFCLNAEGIELSGFLPHVIRNFDGVTISWKVLEKDLTPYALKQIRSTSLKQPQALDPDPQSNHRYARYQSRDAQFPL